MSKQVRLDEVGYWSEIKLDIVKSYAAEYSKIISNQGPFTHHYIDAFSGPGRHMRKGTGEMIVGSPLNALAVQPPFSRYWFIDLDTDKVDFLRSQVGERDDVKVLTGDCNVILLQDIFPRIRYEDFTRALCLIDPYGLDLDWAVVDALIHGVLDGEDRRVDPVGQELADLDVDQDPDLHRLERISLGLQAAGGRINGDPLDRLFTHTAATLVPTIVLP